MQVIGRPVLNRNPLDNITRDAPLAAIVEPGGAGIRVPHQLLHVLQRHSLLEKIGDGGYAEAVGREPRRQPGVFEAALDHSAEVMGPQRVFRQALLASCPE